MYGIEAQVVTPFNLYPNPTNGVVRLSGLIAGDATFTVYNFTGAKVKTGILISENAFIDLSNENMGIYFIEIKENEKVIGTHKLIKE